MEASGLLTSIIVFVLSVFLGFELIAKVPPTLHTPLMSGCNAISGITLVGAILTGGSSDAVLYSFGGIDLTMSALLGFCALVFATINVVGGFLVTDRMHRMFKR